MLICESKYFPNPIWLDISKIYLYPEMKTWKSWFSPPVRLQWEVLVCPAKLVGVLAKRELYTKQIREPVKTTEFFWWGGHIWSGLNVNFLFGTENREGNLRNEINIFERASRVSGSLAPRVSGRKEVATEPARQINIMIMYGIWEKVDQQHFHDH